MRARDYRFNVKQNIFHRRARSFRCELVLSLLFRSDCTLNDNTIDTLTYTPRSVFIPRFPPRNLPFDVLFAGTPRSTSHEGTYLHVILAPRLSTYLRVWLFTLFTPFVRRITVPIRVSEYHLHSFARSRDATNFSTDRKLGVRDRANARRSFLAPAHSPAHTDARIRAYAHTRTRAHEHAHLSPYRNTDVR